MHMRASLEKFRIFTFKNCYFLQHSVGTSDTLSQKHTYIFRSQITSSYIYFSLQSMQFPVITYGMALYINDSLPTKH